MNNLSIDIPSYIIKKELMPSNLSYRMLRFEDVCIVQMIVTGEFGGF